MKKSKKEKKAEKQNKLFEFLGKIDFDHFFTSLKHREIAIFCKTLYSYMSFKDKIRFWFKGIYDGPCKKTFKELLIPVTKSSYALEYKELDLKSYKSGIRKDMIELCVNLLSNMNARYRFMYIVAGYHNTSIWKTYEIMKAKRAKDKKKDLIKRDKTIKKQNKEIAKKHKSEMKKK